MARTVVDERARGGRRGAPVLVVLVAALILAGAAFVGWLLWSGSQIPTSATQAASQQAVNSGPSHTNSSGVPAENPAYPVPAAPKSGGAGTAPAAR